MTTNNHYARKDWVQCDAVGITFVTLVGYMAAQDPKNYPLEKGNCFSMKVKTPKNVVQEFRILNFCYENMKALLDTKIVEFPIKVLLVGSNCAVIHDIRIPDDWYSRFCPSCTPLELMSPEDRLAKWRKVESGEIKISNGSGGFSMESQMIGGERKTLRMEWYGKGDKRAFEAVISVETLPTSIWIKNGKVVKEGGNIKVTRGRPPVEIKGLNITKERVEAKSRSMKLPEGMTVDSQQGLITMPSGVVIPFGANPAEIRKAYMDSVSKEMVKDVTKELKSRYSKKKINKKLYAKVKIGKKVRKEDDFHSSPMDHLK